MANTNSSAPAAQPTTRQLEFQRDQVTKRCQWACHIVGVKFLGIQSGFGLVTDKFLFEQVQGRTLALPVDRATPLEITDHITAANRTFVKKAAA